MSGGFFNYQQYQIRDIVYKLNNVIQENGKKGCDEYGEPYDVFPDHIIEEFKKGLEYLKLAAIYTQRIDWLISGDDGYDTFIYRLNEDLKNVQFFDD
jgi:hypothetical protein